MPKAKAETHDTPRRHFQVYVEIPYSPIPFLANMSSLKRKPSESDVPQTSTKKPKIIDIKSNAVKENKTDAKDPKAIPKKIANKDNDAPSKLLDGYLYCHQCNKKRDAALVIRCTTLDPDTDKLCRGKYCKPCMTNRYGQDIESIKSSSIGKSETKLDYTFECPRCQGICNCRNCRKAQGLEPTGNLTLAARKVGKSAAQLLVANPDQVGVLPGKGQQVISEKKSTVRSKKAEIGSDIATRGPQVKTAVPKPKGQRTKQARPAPIPPQPRWTKVPVPVEMTIDDLETRIFIREFMIRFSTIMDKDAKAHLDELEEIVGDGTLEWSGDALDSDDAEEDHEATGKIPMVSWVSEGCAKSMFIGLLRLLADSSNPALKKLPVDASLKGVRNSSANLTKIWIALACMRKQLGNALYIPDPLPPPTSMPVYYTRRGAVLDPQAEGVQVGRSAQLIPIMECLIEELLVFSKDVKTEIDCGVAEGRETVKQVKEALQREKDRWKTEKDKANGKPGKESREAHKRNISDLEGAQRMMAYSNTFRFRPLGTDEEGRVYYALSPGLAERESILALIDGETAQKPKRGRKAGGGTVSVDESQRKELRHWSWFVAVWGRKPADAIAVENEEKGGMSYNEKEEWWGFWEPDQIRNLAQWIAMRNGLHEDVNPVNIPATGSTGTSTSRADSDIASSAGEAIEDESPLTDLEDEGEDDDDDTRQPPPSAKALKTLVDGLVDYSTLLSWRLERIEREKKMKELEEVNAKPGPGKSVRRVRD